MILTNSDDVVHHVHSVVDHNHNPNHHHHGIDIFNTTTTTTTADHNNSNVSASALSLDYTHHHNNTNTFSNNNYHFFNNNNTSNNHLHHHHHHQFYDSRPFSTYNPFDNISNNSTTPSYFLVPKIEENSSSIMSRHGAATGSTRIGLNLGHRTYFSAQDDDFVNRLYRRSRHGGGGGMEGLVNGMVNSPKCQAEGCVADLSNAKHYHRRHKVCEFHSKASTVIAGGLTQRFCQQCSRSSSVCSVIYFPFNL